MTLRNPLPFLILLLLTSLAASVPQQYLPSSLFDIATTPYASATFSNLYSVTFAGYTRSSSNFKVGFSLHSIDIKFNSLKLQFDLEVTATSTSGFQINFSSTQANLISFLKICYFTKDPSFTQIFYIDTFRYSGPSFMLGNDSTTSANQTFNYPLSVALPTGSLPNIVEKSFLNAWDIDSTVTDINKHIDVFPSVLLFPSESAITLKLQTIRSVVHVFFFSISVVYFQSVLPSAQPLTSEVQPNALARYFSDEKAQLGPGATLMTITSPLQMFNDNTLVGMKAFHARTISSINYLNFKTEYSSNTVVTFPSLNVQIIEHMKFELMVWYQKICPSTDPYLMSYSLDCVVSCPVGYASDVSKNCVPQMNLKLDYIVKLPESNTIEVLFSLEPNDATYNVFYQQINWTNVLTTDIQTTSKTFEYSPTPNPQLKLSLNYAQNLEGQDKTITISAYDSVNFPTNFKGYEQKIVKLPSMTSINNLAIQKYPDSSYQMGKITSYLSMVLSALYMISFLAGFAMGKVYILQMAFVPQVSFISLIGLNNISPSMAGLGFLKYVFGYSFTQFSTDLNIDQNYGQGQNYMTLVGVSTHFIYNYNIMFIFNIIAFILFVVFFIKNRQQQLKSQNQPQQTQEQQKKTYQFFIFDTILYLILWFGLWIIFAGEIQISFMAKSISENNILNIIGIAFFSLNLILFFTYIFLYIQKLSRINSFQQCIKDKNTQAEQNASQSRKKYFYIIYFVQKIIIASLFSFLNSFKFINCIILSLHIILIILLVVFRPYKINDHQSFDNQEEQSTIKPVIRQILNYTISALIQILFFITNQIQSSDFLVYIPLIILGLLLVQAIITIIFLVKDQMIKKDILYLKNLFLSGDPKSQKEFSQVANETPRKQISVNQIKIQLLQKNPSNNLSSNKNQNPINYHNQKQLDQRQQKSDETGQKKVPNNFTTNFDYQNYFQQLNQPKVPKENLSIDQMLEIMAERNHIRQLQESKAQAAAHMLVSAEKMLDKVKKQKQMLENKKKGKKGQAQKKEPEVFKLKSEWQNLQEVDSSRMDKLIAFAAKRNEEGFMKHL